MRPTYARVYHFRISIDAMSMSDHDTCRFHDLYQPDISW